MSDYQSRDRGDAGQGEPDPTSPVPTSPPRAGADQPPTPAPERDADGRTPWYRRRGAPTTIAAVLAFLLGVGVAAGGDEADSAQDELVALTADVSDLEGQVEDYEAEIAELEEDLSEAAAELEAAPDVGELEEELAEAEAALADAETRAEAAAELDARADELDEREQRLASEQESSAAEEPGPAAAAESGCSSGQVDINSAGGEQLQRIHQVGPDRAEQINSLRPFGSVDDLTRVSGIGPAHLDAIKAQGVACVP